MGAASNAAACRTRGIKSAEREPYPFLDAVNAAGHRIAETSPRTSHAIVASGARGRHHA
jgi:hypothetical protein